MPRRIVDGDAVWTSKRLRGLGADPMPALCYVWMLPLAASNAVFESDPELIWRKCFSWFGGWSITPDRVGELLQLYEENGLLFRWRQDEKDFGYWAGMEKPDRLPPTSEKLRKNYVCGPEPPPKRLRAYLRKHKWEITRYPRVNNASLTPP